MHFLFTDQSTSAAAWLVKSAHTAGNQFETCPQGCQVCGRDLRLSLPPSSEQEGLSTAIAEQVLRRFP
jgi:hypothetical protein